MPTPTYTALANITLGSSASSVTFSSIPATYRDLVLVLAGTISASNGMYLRINGDTGANYTAVYAYGNGTLAISDTALVFNGLYAGNFTTTITNSVNQIMDYSATDKHKTMIQRGNDSAALTIMTAARWANTSAITSVQVMPSSGTLSTGFTASLYGIAS